ncbi:MAG: SHOCT domain-containing protein [Actinomycetales bacterium]|nr:SHOCT domain-containing protein [Actinomycetales bacterium]
MMGWYGGGMNGFGWLGMGLFWLVLLGVIVWLVVRLATSGARVPPQPPAAPPVAPPAVPPARPSGTAAALEILDRRLAQGEIDVETYRATRDALMEGRGESR